MKRVAHYFSRFIKMCDPNQMLSTHVSEITKDCLSASCLGPTPHRTGEEGDHLRETRLHVQLLEDGVHVARSTTIPQPHKPRTGPAIHRREVLGRGGGERRESQYLCSPAHCLGHARRLRRKRDRLTDLATQCFMSHASSHLGSRRTSGGASTTINC